MGLDHQPGTLANERLCAFGLEGWDGIPAGGGRAVRHQHEHRQSGIFRTELLSEQSTNYAEASIADYDERSFVQNWSNATNAKMVYNDIHNDLGHITLDATKLIK
jgi:hypothetical protein